MGRICANFSRFVKAGQAPGGKREMERKPETESGSFHVVWQADGKHELQRPLKRSAWGLCLQRDLTRLAGLKMMRFLLKSDVWKWSGVLALDRNIGEVHRNSTRQEKGQQGRAPKNHSADPERGLKVSRTWSQGREGDADRDHEPLPRRSSKRRQRERAGICAGGTHWWNSFAGNKGIQTLPRFLVTGIWDIDLLSWPGEARGLPWVEPMDFLSFLNLLLARLDIYSQMNGASSGDYNLESLCFVRGESDILFWQENLIKGLFNRSKCQMIRHTGLKLQCSAQCARMCAMRCLAFLPA